MTGQEFRQAFVDELRRLGWTEYWSNNQKGTLLLGAGKEGREGKYLERRPRHWAAIVSVTKLCGYVDFKFDNDQEYYPLQSFPKTEDSARAAARAMIDVFSVTQVHQS